ncbi:VOC family protein [Algihabitans albus]|uniref:VOC family protein n=1 Tax=Algihabitans albus TaxID=2164067 RepID=UPI000E5CD9B9|nr:VOC family protein [Algihabitans albus]
MQIDFPGLILFVEDYPACRRFYGETLGLAVVTEKTWDGGGLIAFAWGDTYLMIESGGKRQAEPDGSGSYSGGLPFILRLDVNDLEAPVARLEMAGIGLERRSYPWGEIAVFFDPNGTRLELKSPPTGDAGSGVR